MCYPVSIYVCYILDIAIWGSQAVTLVKKLKAQIWNLIILQIQEKCIAVSETGICGPLIYLFGFLALSLLHPSPPPRPPTSPL